MTNPDTNQNKVQPGQPAQNDASPDQARTDGKQSAAAVDASSDKQKSAPAQNDAAGPSRR